MILQAVSGIKNSNGFTLIEILIVVSILSIVGASVIPVSSNQVSRNAFQTNTNELVAALRTAHLNSLINKEQSQWGVLSNGTSIIIFKGDSYDDRDSAFDQIFIVKNGITISTEEIVFDIRTGNIDESTNITVSNTTGNSHTISINEFGNVNIQ